MKALRTLGVVFFAVVLLSVLGASQGKDGAVQGRDTTVARVAYLEIAIARYNQLAEQKKWAEEEMGKLGGQIQLLQAMKNDSIKIPLQ